MGGLPPIEPPRPSSFHHGILNQDNTESVFSWQSMRPPRPGSSSSSSRREDSRTQAVATTSAADDRRDDGEDKADSSKTPTQKRKLTRAATTYPRKRATHACLTCRFRRTKCDNVRPACASCVRLGAECRYQEADPSTFDQASLAILKRLDDLEGLLQSSRTRETQLSAAATAPPPPPFQSYSPSVHQSDLASSVIELPPKAKRPLVSIEAVLQWPPLTDYGFPSSLYRAPRPEDSMTEPAGGWVPVDVDLPGAEASMRAFFDNVHIFNPVLEEEDVRNYIRRVRLDGIGWDAVSCLVLLIYAHGCIATGFVNITQEGTPSNFRRSHAFLQAESYFQAAQKRMGMLLCRSGVIDAQCFFLAGVYLMTTLRPAEAWRMFVQALACCQGFSIDQEPGMLGSEAESNPKRRIYWTAFKSELELRLELNPSQKDVWDLTYPAFFPSPPGALKSKDETAWYFYLAEIALMRLKNRILSFLYRFDRSVGPDQSVETTIVDFEEQMEAWSQSLPKQLELNGADSDKQQHEALRFILSGHFLDCQEVMYWQFIVDVVVHGRRPLPGTGSESFLRKGLQVCVDRIRQNRPGFGHRHHGTWLMIRSCTRSALVLLAAVRCPDLTPYVPMGWEEAVFDVKGMLELWKDESADVLQMLNILEVLINSRRR